MTSESSVFERAKLHELTQQVVEVALSLATASANSDRKNGLLSKSVRRIIRARQLRGRLFDQALFADPAWDMMLDLFVAELEGRSVSISSLCIASNVSTSTALRLIRKLVEQGIFCRESDPADARRILIGLSKGTSDKVRRTLELEVDDA